MKLSPVFLPIVATLCQVFAHEDEPLALRKDVSCRVRAWVRAPNLEPGQVLQGDVKVKLDGTCDDVSSYSLGLRFAERSWVKTLREGVTIPVKPKRDFLTGFLQSWGNNQGIYNNVTADRLLFGSGEENRTAWDQYENKMKSPEIWVVREEERIGFETKYRLYDAQETQEPPRHIVRSFALFVPSTNYPPAFDSTSMSGSSRQNVNTAGSEHIYKYFIDVSFSNGTNKEIDAGYTSFDGVATPPVDRHSVSINVTATKLERSSILGEELVDNISPDKFTLEVTFPEGRHFKQGSTNSIMITSHRFGPGLQQAVRIEHIHAQGQPKLHWAAKHAANNETAEELLNYGWVFLNELQPKLGDSSDWSHSDNSNINIPRFSRHNGIENGTLFSTEPITAQLQVPARAYPSFGMYYQTREAQLVIYLRVGNVSEEGSQPGAALVDEEYYWTPSLQEQFSYEGTELLEATIPIFVHHAKEHRTDNVPNLVHYLSPDARAPVFMDPASLVQMTPEERDHLAPHCEAKIFAKADQDVVKERYYAWGSKAPQAYYYVGNTWLKWVTRSDRDRPQQNVLVNQS